MATRARLARTVEDVRESYWALPGLIALLGLGAGLGMVFLDAFIGNAWLGRYAWLYGSRPEGARAMLSTIAGSTITVAGVVFSNTLAAVTYASGQFGPRLLGDFTRDRGNQTTLGIFIGTYLYCLVVLRTIRSAAETSAETGGAVRDAFVPHAAMFGGLALAIVSTAVLIYFVHHVTTGIHINTVIAQVGRRLIGALRALRDQADEDGAGRGALEPPRGERGSVIVAATDAGYVEALDRGGLRDIARRNDLLLHARVRAGDFVASGHPLFDVEPADRLTGPIARDLIDAVALGRQRTARQDLLFSVDELVEIAARALSPGVNDPFTAIACLDWLGAVLGEAARCGRPRRWLADNDGTPRLILRPLEFFDFLHTAFGQLRPYVAADPNARRHALMTLDRLVTQADDGQHRALLEEDRDALASAAT